MCFKYFYSKGDRMRMKNYDYKAKMNRNRKRLAKQVAGVAIATTFTLSTPIAPSIIEDSSFKNVISSSVVHAATDNLFEFNDTLTNFTTTHNAEYEWTRHIVNGTSDNQITFDDKSAFTIVIQLPEELSHILDDSAVLEHLQGNGPDTNNTGKFGLTGHVFENGKTDSDDVITISSSDHN